jgi:hypothetical protein
MPHIGEIEMMKLYSVTTNGCVMCGCKDVTLHWFRRERTPRPYAELIEGYDASDAFLSCAEGAIDELFTQSEAHALEQYLSRHQCVVGQTVIEECTLPVPHNMLALGAMPYDRGDCFYTLDEDEAYSLPFKVEGYFTLVGCEPVDSFGTEAVNLAASELRALMRQRGGLSDDVFRELVVARFPGLDPGQLLDLLEEVMKTDPEAFEVVVRDFLCAPGPGIWSWTREMGWQIHPDP